MARYASLLVALLLIGASPAARAAPPHPLVVELFQSQGCSSCPPANANLNAIADRPDILALSFAVTYWDDLGWKDTFAHKQYTQRQYDYAHAMGHPNVATPQVVINGARDIVGADRRDFDATIAAARAPQGPEISFASRGVSIGAGDASKTAAGADVWLVRYDPRVEFVSIQRGENNGKTLPHKNIVKELRRLGDWRGTPIFFALAPASDRNLKTAVLVQGAQGGPILAAMKE